jgi:hypothetical protein
MPLLKQLWACLIITLLLSGSVALLVLPLWLLYLPTLLRHG